MCNEQSGYLHFCDKRNDVVNLIKTALAGRRPRTYVVMSHVLILPSFVRPKQTYLK